MATAKRTTHRSTGDKKLYAVRNAQGEFKDIQTYERAHGSDVQRTSKAEVAARAKKAASKKSAAKSAPKKSAVKKSAVKKSPVKKSAAKKSAPKKRPAKPAAKSKSRSKG
jgi:hypothetical protein